MPHLIHLVSIWALSFRSIINAQPVVTNSKSGVTYHGSVLQTVEHFQNIKYALDTSGEKRFAPPEPFTPSPGTVIDASSRGPACPQLHDAMPPFFSSEPEISEDCLSLRIDRPVGTTPSSKLPVIVWLHGGGVVKGSAYDPHFDPTNLIKLSVSQNKPVIYASLNYRISIFGFARSESLKDAKSLNAGIRDQRLGFQWIKDNIEAWGGDPEKITVYGLSAGGTFISLHPMLYGGEHGVPFQQAWMMSGPPGTALNMTSDATAYHTHKVAKSLGCDKVEDKGTKMIECLRKLSTEELISKAMEYSIANHPPAGLFTFIPSMDGDIIPDSQSSLIGAGKFVKGIRMILGWTQDDGAMNVGPGHLIQTEDDMINTLKSFVVLSTKQLSTLFSLYRSDEFQEELDNYNGHKGPGDPEISIHYFRISRILRDMLFTCSSIDFGRQMTQQTRAAGDHDFSSIRLYDLNQSVLTPLWKGAGMPYVQVSHGSDTNYIFNGVFPEGEMSSSDQDLSERFTLSLINFAYTGNPTPNHGSGKQLDYWPSAYAESADKSTSNVYVQVIGGPFGTGPATLSEGHEGEGYEPPKLGEQQVLKEEFGYTQMHLPGSKTRQRLLDQEKLITRCRYVNSLSKTLGI